MNSVKTSGCDFVRFTKEEVEQSIVKRFEQQVLVHADHLAVTDMNSSVTYDALNRLANRIARSIIAARPESGPAQVGIYLEKGIQYIAAILATLKAGHCYVPIDPAFPQTRNDHIIHDSQATLILSNSLNYQSAADSAPPLVPIINLDELAEDMADDNLNLDISPDALAYIIYTSGSTGKPKGVMQNHRNTLHGCMRRTNLQRITPMDRMTLFYSCSVMGSVYCIFGSLLNGASLFSYDFREEGLDNLAEWLQTQQITIYHSVASVFRRFAENFHGCPEAFQIRLVIFGGERVLTSDVELARRVFSNSIEFFTGLGSTETGTIRHFPIGPETVIDTKVVPIGYSVEGMEVTLLDDQGQPVALGDIGEICVTSRYLALGYWNNVEATKRVFAGVPGDATLRRYHMGDMGELNHEGLLEHRGRKDFQVKIRGFRVEVAEIETALLDHAHIAEAVVVAQEIDQELQLVAYVVGKAARGLDVRALRKHLQSRLPYYMIPTVFVGLPALPRTPNNKVDRNALPQPLPSNELSDCEQATPVNEVEQGLIEICTGLLHRSEIGTNQNFFDLGGHSLSATQLVSRVNQRFGAKLTMRTVFEAEDLKDLAAHIESAVPNACAHAGPGLSKVSQPGRLPVSFAQRRMWLIDQLYGGSSAYNISNSVRLEGCLDVAALERSLAEIVARHEILRTVFPSDEEGPWQEIRSCDSFVLKRTDLRDLPPEKRETQALQLAHEQLCQPHNLAKGPLFHAQLIHLSDTAAILVLVFNHIIYDNIWSSGIFFRELGELYRTFSRQQASSSLPPLEFQFADYAHWEHTRARQSNLQEHMDYWKRQLADLPTPLHMPADRMRLDKPSFQGARIDVHIPASIRSMLAYLAQDESATMFMVLLAVWQLLLHRYTQQDDILVGTPTGRRYRPETEDMIGLFINNLVIRTDFSDNPGFRQLLRRVRQTSIDAFSHDEVPFEDVVAELHPERSAGTSPFFQHLFIHRNATHSKWCIPGLEVYPLNDHAGGAKFDLTLSILEDAHQLSGTLEYSSDLFDRHTVERMAANYVKLLTSVAEDPDCPVQNLELLADSERRMVYEELNQTTFAYPADLCTHQLFEQQARQHPDAIAVISDDGNLTYGELNRRANQLAGHLQGLGVGPEKLVAVCLNRSSELIVALLGVLKAGGAYVPLDPYFPTDRLSYMIDDANASVFISQQSVIDKFPELKAKTVLLEAHGAIFAGSEKENPAVSVKPDNLAYVIYTSGSTGKPKGVQLQHRGLVNFLCSMQWEPGITKDDVWQTLTTVSFDIAALEIFLPLITGARIVVESRVTSMDPTRLLSSLKENAVTILQATPVTWRTLLDYGWHGDPKLKVLCGGEAMGLDLAERLLESGCEVWNLYGPTETTIWSSLGKVKAKEDAAFIGWPIANTELHVLSPQLALQPIGVPGELFIGGDGLARGYLNREELTREKFISHPFEAQKRLYRTGDLVVRRANGAIEFLGRMDNQVKLRGFRIELGEIEAVLANYSDIKQNVVMAREDSPGDKCLVAYLVTRDDVKVDTLALREFLREQLPEYMVPASFVTLTSFPLTANGKIDRKKLPKPSGGLERSGGQSPEQDATTAELIEVFEETLKVPVTSTQASFFDLGGHSLSALNTVAKINRRFSVELPPMLLFDHPTIAALSAVLKDMKRLDVEPEAFGAATLSAEETQKVDQILNSIQALSQSHTLQYAGSCPKMRESWICKHILAPLYPARRASLKKLITRLILKLEGGRTAYTVTLRKLFRQCYDIHIGDFTSVSFDANRLQHTTRIGRYCSIFRTASFQNADHPRNTVATHGVFYHPELGFTPGYELDRVQIEIGNDVWIGDGAKILYPTKRIGDGAVIAAGAVVVEDVPAYAIVGGYPAQVIRYRFSKQTIEKLLKLRWWEFSLEELQSVRDEFMKPLEGNHIR